MCTPISGSDTDACGGTRSCSQGGCVDVDQAISLTGLSSVSVGSASDTKRVAQVIATKTSGELIELRMTMTCSAQDKSLLSAGIFEVDASGAPTDSMLAALTVQQQPTERRSRFAPNTVSLFAQTSLNLTAGQQFALVIDGSSATASCDVHYGTGLGDHPGEAVWISSSSGWSQRQQWILGFKLLVRR
jgi:hypothetical protein